jgi:hypothetical protein
MANDIISTIKAADQAKKNALRELHKALGYATPKALAEAILEAANITAPVERKPSAEDKKPPSSAAERVQATAEGKRPRISDETKREIGDALRAGQAGNRLTKQFGVSYGVIHEIKTRLGLVSKKKASKKKR